MTVRKCNQSLSSCQYFIFKGIITLQNYFALNKKFNCSKVYKIACIKITALILSKVKITLGCYIKK